MQVIVFDHHVAGLQSCSDPGIGSNSARGEGVEIAAGDAMLETASDQNRIIAEVLKGAAGHNDALSTLDVDSSGTGVFKG